MIAQRAPVGRQPARARLKRTAHNAGCFGCFRSHAREGSRDCAPSSRPGADSEPTGCRLGSSGRGEPAGSAAKGCAGSLKGRAGSSNGRAG
eukprot:1273840-Rhodomonas_salina.2